MTSKLPDLSELYQKVQNQESSLLDYIKLHDINQPIDEQGNTLLHAAARHRYYNDITCLSHFFINPNIKNADGQTAAQLAKDPECFEHLHQYHLCIDFDKASSEPNGLDALFAAIYRGDTTLGDTSGIKNKGNENNQGGWTALHCAAIYDRPHLIRELHQRFPKLDANCLNYAKLSALSIAAKYGHSNCIIALCECFPTIKARGALQATCQYNQSACIHILRQYFPQLTGNELAHTHKFSSALMRAALHNNPECIRLLHSCFPDIDPNLRDCGSTALIATVDRYENRRENFKCIPVLFECFPDIDPNKQDNDGYTALMHACEQGFSQSITLLATYFPSIDVNLRNKKGETALMWVIKRDHEQCLETLCESFPNIDPNIQNRRYGETALMLAVCTKNPEPFISQLHKVFPDIDPNVQDHFGQTALMFAVRRDNSEPIISQLCKLFPNIDLNKQDEDKDTALMYLLKFRPVRFVRNFLDTFPNVDVNIQNAKAETALTLAIEKGNASIVALLLERFPDISFISWTGQTALMFAIKKARLDVVSMLLKHISQIE